MPGERCLLLVGYRWVIGRRGMCCYRPATVVVVVDCWIQVSKERNPSRHLAIHHFEQK
jgi:hypothetical protein